MRRTKLSILALLVPGLAGGCKAPDSQSGDDESADTTGNATDDPTGNTTDAPTGGMTGENDDAPLPFEPGSRLIPRAVASPEDPARVAQLLGWHDQTLALDCSFATTVDGDIRCVPIDTLAIRGFSSPDCAPGTEIVIIAAQQFDCDQGLVTYWQNAPTADESCGQWFPEYGAIKLGQKLAITQGYRNDGGACVPQWKPSPDWTANYCQYSEAPLADFVRADTLSEPVGAVQRQTLVGEDGSRQVWRGYDPELKHEVYPDRGRLLPPVGGQAEAFSDPGCTTPAACGTPCRGGVTLFWDDELCAADVARLGVTEVDGYAGDTCMAITLGPGSTCYEVVELRPPLLYEPLQVGAGRLQRTWARHADTPLVPDGSFYDTVLETPCFAIEASPGQFQCEASAAQMHSVFSDPECLVRLGAEYENSCKPPPGAVGSPDGPLRVMPLPAVEGPTYTRNGQPDDGPAFNCSARPNPTPLYDLLPAEVGWAPMIKLP